MLMRLLVSFTKGIMMAIGITLPKPEQEKTVALIWVAAFFVMIGIILGVGWAVLTSFSNGAR
jgi:high-affinity Fe2+/Pb2+ permease